MSDFKIITVTEVPGHKVNIKNPTPYKLIERGDQGAVFKIDDMRCVKIHAKSKFTDMEYLAYRNVKNSVIVPKIYERGTNYIIMEYLRGPSLDRYLQGKSIMPKWLTPQLLYVLKKMKELHFTRTDAALRHIFVEKDNHLKIIDLVHAFTKKSTYPVKLLGGLSKLGLLKPFLQQVKEIEPKLYLEWKRSLKL